jgi:seryl-tRNA synthetase
MNDTCPTCGPGYRYGDEGCRHEPSRVFDFPLRVDPEVPDDEVRVEPPEGLTEIQRINARLERLETFVRITSAHHPLRDLPAELNRAMVDKNNAEYQLGFVRHKLANEQERYESARARAAAAEAERDEGKKDLDAFVSTVNHVIEILDGAGVPDEGRTVQQRVGQLVHMFDLAQAQHVEVVRLLKAAEAKLAKVADGRP